MTSGLSALASYVALLVSRLRQYGAGYVLLHALQRVSPSVFAVSWLVVTELPTEADQGGSGRWAVETDLEAIAAIDDCEVAELSERLKGGDRAFVLFEGDRVASYAWVAADEGVASGFVRTVPPASAVWSYDWRTDSALQGRGLAPRMLRGMCAALRAEGGVTSVLSAQEAVNPNARKTATKAGGREFARILAVRVRRFGWCRIVGPAPPPSWIIFDQSISVPPSALAP